jgi:hypothetical protein
MRDSQADFGAYMQHCHGEGSDHAALVAALSDSDPDYHKKGIALEMYTAFCNRWISTYAWMTM